MRRRALRNDAVEIAMAAHGHKLLNDVLRGSVANTVRHNTTVPVLLVRGSFESKP